MGNTYICVKAMLDELGIEYVIPPYNNKKALEIGTKYAPEMACLPLKINIGNFIQAHEQGADTALIVGGCGPCRFGYYCEMHREILKDVGANMDVITLEMPDQGVGELYRRVRKLAGGFNIYKIAKAVKDVVVVAKQVDDLERLTFRLRPRELEKGSVNRIYRSFLDRAYQVKGAEKLRRLVKETMGKLLSVKIDREVQPLRVGIVGEIYANIDPYANFNISSRLGSMGLEIDRRITISGWIMEHIIKKAFHLPKNMDYVEASKPYLGAMIGGHARETVGHSVLYANQGYDGVIQLYPLTCMPEIVAESILPSVEADHGMPILTLIVDEMTGETGYQTRLEAFVDLLKKRRERKAVEEKFVLHGN